MGSKMSIGSKKKQTDFALHRRALNCIAQGSLTNSKSPDCFVKGVYPTHLKRGEGCHVWDVQNRKYIDFITALGTNLLGYGNETILSHVVAFALRNGNLLSLGTEQEVKTAEKLKEIFPFVDAWKFLKTGNEACLAAIQIAKAKTGRTRVLGEDYHGWFTKECFEPLDFFHIQDAAAVIIEPVVTDLSPERITWLQKLRDECTKHRTLLIFDEVVTGFRFPKFSVANYTGINPDLICLGKAMSNGYSLSAVGGKFEIMNGDYFVSSTFAGSLDALVACEQVITLMQKDTRYRIEELWNAGQKFIDDFNKIDPEHIKIEGYPTRGIFKGDDEFKAKFFQEACYAGILLGPSFFFNFPMMQECYGIMGTFRDIIYKINKGDVQLAGEMPKSATAQKLREKS